MKCRDQEGCSTKVEMMEFIKQTTEQGFVLLPWIFFSPFKEGCGLIVSLSQDLKTYFGIYIP